VLFVAAVVLMMAAPATSEYDGVMSIISVGVTAVVIAVLSMIAAMCVRLPLRLVPALRSRWLANGEMTVAGAGLGLIVCAAVIAAMATNSGEGEALAGSGTLFAVLTAGWALLAISVAHFVWPARWKRTTSG